MRRLPLAALLVPSALCVAAPAFAAPKPVCLQVTDATGDAKAYGALDSASIDVVSADLATGRRNLVGVVRLRSSEREAFLVGGRAVSFSWVAGGVRQMLLLTEYDTGDRVGTFHLDPADATGIAVPVVVDPNADTVTWTVARRLVPALRKPGAKLGSMTVTASEGKNVKATGTTGRSASDVAESGRVYTDMAPSCVKGT